ncbi:hypothetical protein BH11BAC5_BH11BAC5_30690 [soil metagenome]
MIRRIKYVAVVFVCLAITNLLDAQDNKSAGTSRLEDKIRQYFFVMLTTGSNRIHDSATAAKIQEGHMANINRLYYDGKLKVAGPFGDDGNWRGIFIFDCKTKEEVEDLLKTDPAIASGRLAYEVHPWWTAAMGNFAPGKPEKKP